jgi:hypothetical protein
MIVIYNCSDFMQELHCIFCRVIVDGLTCYTRSWKIEGLFSFLVFTLVHAGLHNA